MGKMPYIQFFPGDWLSDPALMQCAPATRGIWIDLICLMHQNNRSGSISGTLQGLARICRATESEMSSALSEIVTTNSGSVTFSDQCVTVECFRMLREAKQRENNRLRQERHREKQKTEGVSRSPNGVYSYSYSNSNTKTNNNPPYIPPLSDGNEGGEEPEEKPPEPEPTKPKKPKATKPPPVPPDGLNLEAWDEYEQHRRELGKKKLQPTTVAKRWRWLINQGPPDIQRQIIDRTIMNGWTGLFPHKPEQDQDDGQNRETNQRSGASESRASRVYNELERIACQGATASHGPPMGGQDLPEVSSAVVIEMDRPNRRH